MTEHVPALLAAERQSWARAFQQHYGMETSIVAAHHDDAVLVLAEAMKRVGPTRSQVAMGLDRLQGPRGGRSS